MSTINTTQSNPAPDRSRETRIGLVMYGGVSLAVYINGVSQEFYHAVQGNGVYRLIKELTDSEIVLDIVSGSSAGGVNGILLAYALCNGKDFTLCSDLWRNGADIHRLVRTPTSGPETVRSVLDSEGYYQTELERAFQLVAGTSAKGESPSPLKELDLFITGTDMDGHIQKRVDDAGHVIEVKDYRSVFHLKHRRGRKSNMDSSSNPAVITALAKLARITSCFPGAFAPVFVSHANISGKSPTRMSANELLQYWGSLPDATFLIDGGVIDNKPFTHTTREISFRTTERKVDRRLYYVEPDIERFRDRDGNSIPNAPSFLKPILNSLVTIPGYESITDDLKLLAERNENIREYRRLLQDVASTYEFAGKEKLGVEIPSEILEPQRSIYSRARYASISSRVLEGVFKEATFENSLRVSAYRKSLIQEFDSRTSHTTGILRDFDVLFRLRRIFHLIYVVYERLYAPTTEQSETLRERYLPLLKRLNRQLELYDVLHSAMERTIHDTDYGLDEKKEPVPGEIWDKVVASLQLLLRAEGLVSHLDNLQELNTTLHRRIDRLSEGLSFPIGDFTSVLVHADNLESAFLAELLEEDDPVFLRYLHFNAIDASLFPLEWVSGLREKDVINVCRISPTDAQRGFSARAASTKTAGDSMAHFSAFFKRTWRSNDIMWGRLDGVCELVETLLTAPAIESAMSSNAARQRARETLLPSDGSPSPLDEWFRDSSESAVQRIKSWVESVTDADPWTRSQALTSFYTDNSEQSGESIRNLLIEMAQFRIMHESLPHLFEDSIREQAQWKQLRKPSAADPAKLQWVATDVGMDDTALNALASIGGRRLLEELEAGRPTELSPKESRLGKMFGQFQIGSEEVWGGGVPFLVLGEIGLKALLVLKSCILGSFSERTGNRIRASSAFRWGLDLPLRSLYSGLTFFRSAPPFQPAILAGGTLLSILALLVGLKWRDAIIQPGGRFSILWFCVFIVAPLAWLTASAYQLARTRSRERLSDGVRNALIAICTAAPLISVTMLYFGLTDLVRDWWNGTLAPVGSRNIQLLMVLLYGIVPFALSFLGGYLAVQARHKEPELEDLAGALERLTESDLQDVCDRVGERHQVTPESRMKIVKALTVAAEMNNGVGTLTRAIRAVSPGSLG